MTERERLVKLLCSAPFGSKTFLQQYYKSIIIEIADYLLANGVIVPPLKVGDKLWGFDEEGFVTEYEIKRVDIQLVVETTYYMFYGVNENDELVTFNYDDIGKTVFLTKEEAEKALKGRK